MNIRTGKDDHICGDPEIGMQDTDGSHGKGNASRLDKITGSVRNGWKRSGLEVALA